MVLCLLRKFGQFAAWRLREMTHEEQPWKETEQNGEISLETMRTTFSSQIAR